ncbi:MAG TPA: DUF3841 domain-containing protein [Herpetosiphonaceae bacterium]
MKLWTIQTRDAWQKLQQQGCLRAELRYIDPNHLMSYQWMIDQARQRIGPAPAGCQSLIWAWYQWQNQSRRKPDLRFSAHLPKGTAGVRLELEVDDAQVLLSDFELWHHVLNYWYLPASKADDEAFAAELEQLGLPETKRKLNPAYDERIRRSWRRIFDLDWSDEYIARSRAQKSIQAVFWELHIEQVQHVQHFVAK